MGRKDFFEHARACISLGEAVRFWIGFSLTRNRFSYKM